MIEVLTNIIIVFIATIVMTAISIAIVLFAYCGIWTLIDKYKNRYSRREIK